VETLESFQVFDIAIGNFWQSLQNTVDVTTRNSLNTEVIACTHQTIWEEYLVRNQN
jgi:hypothetical protein